MRIFFITTCCIAFFGCSEKKELPYFPDYMVIHCLHMKHQHSGENLGIEEFCEGKFQETLDWSINR